jgi:hypothetical protein
MSKPLESGADRKAIKKNATEKEERSRKQKANMTESSTPPRQVSLVPEQWDAWFSGGMLSSAICFADVDDDGRPELILGGIDGTLAVYRCLEDTVPVYEAKDLGTISCICTVARSYNSPKNLLVVICAEGYCHFFDIVASAAAQKPATYPPSETPVGGAALSCQQIHPAQTTIIPVNVNTAIVFQDRPESSAGEQRLRRQSSEKSSSLLALGSRDASVHVFKLTVQYIHHIGGGTAHATADGALVGGTSPSGQSPASEAHVNIGLLHCQTCSVSGVRE